MLMLFVLKLLNVCERMISWKEKLASSFSIQHHYMIMNSLSSPFVFLRTSWPGKPVPTVFPSVSAPPMDMGVARGHGVGAGARADAAPKLPKDGAGLGW